MSLILGASAVLVALVVAAALWVVGRQAWQRFRATRFVQQAQRVQAELRAARQRNYDGLDKLLFEMRELYDLRVIEGELRDELDHAGTAADAPPDRLRVAFQLLGLTDRYLARVRQAGSWEERARAATTLGALGDIRAVKPLVEAMRDSREDADVKLACAEALGRLRDPTVVPILCAELESLDEWSSPRLAHVLSTFGVAAVEPLLEVLDKAQGLNARVWAAQVLGKIGDRRAVPPLLARLHDRSEQMRLSVASALGDLADGRGVRPLIEIILRDPVPAVRAQSAIALGRIGDLESLPLLVGALGDPEYWVRFRALEAIEALAPEDTGPIESALQDANRDVRHRAALALERLGRLEAPFADLGGADEIRTAAARERLILIGRAGLSERLARHLTDPDATMRRRIAGLLGAVGDLAHADALIGRLGDGDEAVRLAAIEALGDLGKPGTAAALLPLLRGGHKPERDTAVAALIRFPVSALEAVIEPLSALLDEESDDIRVAATRVLAVIPGERVAARLRDALADRFVEVRVEAVRALGDRQDLAAVDTIGVCLAEASEPLRVASADALGLIGGPRAIELLLAALPAADAKQRDSICDTLARFGFDAIRPALDVLLAAEDVKSRLGAVWTLGKTRDPRAVPLLGFMLREPEVTVRSSAAGALGKIAHPSAIQVLRGGLEDPSPYVRSASVNAIGAIGGEPEVAASSIILDDPDPFVRNRGGLAVGRLGGASAYAALTAPRPESLSPEVRCVALGLSGTPAGVAAAVQMMDDREVRRGVNELLGREDRGLKRRFFVNLRIEERADGLPQEIDVAALLPRYADSLRNSHDVETRRVAASVLSGIPDEKATEALAAAVRFDPDRDVRSRAASSLAARSEAPSARAALLGAVKDPFPGVRITAIRALAGAIGPREAGPLLDALRSIDAEVAEAAEVALAQIYGGSIAELHDWMMAQEREALLAAGLRIVGRIGDARSLGLARALLRSAAPAVRGEAARALAALRLPEAQKAMLDTLSDPSEEVRVAVVRGLRGATRADVLARLADAGFDPSAAVRTALADTAATTPGSWSVEVLARLAADSDPEVAARGARGLLLCADGEGLARFEVVWPELSLEARRRLVGDAAEAEARLEQLIATALEPGYRQAAVRVLAGLGAGANAERIARALGDPDAKVRLTAVQALSGLDPDRVGDWLRRVLDDPVADVRTAARRAVWKLV